MLWKMFKISTTFNSSHGTNDEHSSFHSMGWVLREEKPKSVQQMYIWHAHTLRCLFSRQKYQKVITWMCIFHTLHNGLFCIHTIMCVMCFLLCVCSCITCGILYYYWPYLRYVIPSYVCSRVEYILQHKAAAAAAVAMKSKRCYG